MYAQNNQIQWFIDNVSFRHMTGYQKKFITLKEELICKNRWIKRYCKS